ncbi:MAG: hypothetical protein ACK4TI_01060 [Nitrososphaerales archaeon]
MMLETIISLIALLSAILALLVTLKRERKQSGIYPDPDIMSAFAEEYSRRINKLETRLVDLQVRLDILETKTEKTTPREEEEKIKKVSFGELISHKPQDDITKFSRELSNFELTILKCVAEGSKTPSEVKAVVGHSREHVARALKDLYEAGFLYRQGGRPFIYSLSSKGRAVLGGEEVTT